MDYRRYSLGSYARHVWIECTECGTPNKPFYVWERNDRACIFSEPVGAVMQHELASHPVVPVKR